MEENVEYEIPINCMKRLTQKDNSDDFDLIVNFSNKETKNIKIRTTLNKARVISKRIDEIYQIDPTITNFQLRIPSNLFKTKNEETSERIRMIKSDIEIILRSSTEKVQVTREERERITIIEYLLGEKIDKEEMITMNSISEAISYLSTEFHQESIKFLSAHMREIIDEDQIFHLEKEIIKEIIDSYFETSKEAKEKEELFEKMKNIKDAGVVMHFLLQVEYEEYNDEMREYISNNLSDDIVYCELGQIIKKFIKQLHQKESKRKRNEKEEKGGNIKVEYKGDELKGIISHLKEKYGENICEQEELKICDKGNHHHVYGSLLNLIKYDKENINKYYRNNGGEEPVPNSSEGWIEFDFKKRKINLTSYTLRSFCNYFAKSWRIVGSNDRKEWELIDQQTNNSSLKGRYKQHRFECQNNDKYYQYIRYIQDDSWRSDRKHNVDLSCVEFFGSIST